MVLRSFRIRAKRSQRFWEARACVRNILNQFWSSHMHKNRSWLIYSVSRSREMFSTVLRSFRVFAKCSQRFWEAFARSQNVLNGFERLSRVRKMFSTVLRGFRAFAKRSQRFWEVLACTQNVPDYFEDVLHYAKNNKISEPTNKEQPSFGWNIMGKKQLSKNIFFLFTLSCCVMLTAV